MAHAQGLANVAEHVFVGSVGVGVVISCTAVEGAGVVLSSTAVVGAGDAEPEAEPEPEPEAEPEALEAVVGAGVVVCKHVELSPAHTPHSSLMSPLQLHLPSANAMPEPPHTPHIS